MVTARCNIRTVKLQMWSIALFSYVWSQCFFVSFRITTEIQVTGSLSIRQSFKHLVLVSALQQIIMYISVFFCLWFLDYRCYWLSGYLFVLLRHLILKAHPSNGFLSMSRLCRFHLSLQQSYSIAYLSLMQRAICEALTAQLMRSLLKQKSNFGISNSLLLNKSVVRLGVNIGFVTSVVIINRIIGYTIKSALN